MKRKISLFVAALMMMSVMPTTGVFAASANRIPIPATGIASDKDWGEGLVSTANTATVAATLANVPVLLIDRDQKPETFKANSMFMVSLTGAEWSLGSADTLDDANQDARFGVNTEYYAQGETLSGPIASAHASLSATTADASKGVMVVSGGAVVAGGYTNEINYVVKYVSSTEAEVTILTAADLGNSTDMLYLPLVTELKAETATVTLTDTAASGVSASTLTFATATDGTINIKSTKPTKLMSKTYTLDEIKIDETTVGKIDLSAAAETLTFKAPSGFEWVSSSSPKIAFYGGFSGVGSITGTYADSTNAVPGWEVTDDVITFHTGKGTGHTGATIAKTTTSRGFISVTGLQLRRVDASVGDINIKVKVGSESSQTIKVGEYVKKAVTLTVDETDTMPQIVNGKFAADNDEADEQVLDITIEEGTLGAWNVESADGNMAVLDLGDDVKVKSVKVVDVSNIPAITKNSWATRTLEGEIEATNTVIAGGVSIDKDGKVVLEGITRTSGKTMKLALRMYVTVKPGYTGDITVTTDNEDTDSLPRELSAKVGEAINPITVTAETTKVDLGYMSTPLADIIIKENVAGALVEYKQSDSVYAGNESTPGNYTQNDDYTMLTMWLGSKGDVGFNPETAKAEVVSGDIKVDKLEEMDIPHTTIEGLALKIDSASDEASEIKITGAAVSTYRSLPAGKIDLRMGGMVVANSNKYESTSFSASDASDDFGGFSVDYITAVKDYVELTDVNGMGTSPVTGGNNGVINNMAKKEVSVKIGTTDMAVAGTSMTSDVASFQVGGVSYLPLRAVATAFGLADTDLEYDPNTKRVTVRNTPVGAVQFQIDSEYYVKEGVQVSMYDEVTKARPTAKLVNGRTFLPLRILGEKVFLGTVDYDAATQTAYINKGAGIEAPAAAETTAPATETTPATTAAK